MTPLNACAAEPCHVPWSSVRWRIIAATSERIAVVEAATFALAAWTWALSTSNLLMTYLRVGEAPTLGAHRGSTVSHYRVLWIAGCRSPRGWEGRIRRCGGVVGGALGCRTRCAVPGTAGRRRDALRERLRGAVVGGERDAHRRATALARLGAYRAPVARDDRGDDRQAQPRATARAAPARGVSPEEPLEHLLDVLGGDAGPAVTHLERRHALGCADRDLAR